MPSIGVLEHNQKPTERPSRRIKKAGGQSLVNRGMAFWLIENVLLKMIESLPHASLNAGCPVGATRGTPSTYIPAKMPSHKTPGTKAEGPLVEKSRTGIFRIMQANQIAREIRA